VANGCWWLACLPGTVRFASALQRPAEAQDRILLRTLRRNAETDFGRRHGFARLAGADAYRSAVPLSTYEDYRPSIERIAAGAERVLTREPVRVLEPTSGSTAAAKWIPYTAGLQRQFARGIAPWIGSLFLSRPDLARGRAYWSITPRTRTDLDTGSRIPVGFADDTAYLAGPLGRILRESLAVPPEVEQIAEVETFRYVTARLLLGCADLRLISVWHPSYLELLLDGARRHWQRLLADVRAGTLTGPGELPAIVHGRIRRRLRPDPRRARALERAGGDRAAELWPRLGLISCWGDGHAAGAARELGHRIPDVELQPKGLLATEAFVSLPWRGTHVLAVRSHFFEFLTADGESRLAHQLEAGATYSVVVTTDGGLYRYRLEDRVKVTGFAGSTPTLRFLGKEGHVSDRRGEKLHAAFVADAVARALGGRRARFALLAPDATEAPPGYTLFVEPAGCWEPSDLATALERELSRNPHYRECVGLGQLRPARVFRVTRGGFEAWTRRQLAAGRRLGDLKPAALDTRCGWDEVFEGSYEDTRAPSRRSA